MKILKLTSGLVSVAVLVVVFQNCAGNPDVPHLNNSSTAPVPAPIINGAAFALGPCVGNGQSIVINGESPAGAPLVLPDKGVVWAAGKLQAVSSSSNGVLANRLVMTEINTGTPVFYPGASYSPSNPQNFILSAAVGLVDPGSYSLVHGIQNVQSVTSKSTTGAYYPLCGQSPVIALSKTENATAASPVLDLTLNESATVIVAGEKTVSNVPTSLSISLSVLNVDTGSVIPCAVQGTTSWYFASTSTPSVSGYCQIQLAPGHYRFSNVITTDAANLAGTQHLGFLAVRTQAGEKYDNF